MDDTRRCTAKSKRSGERCKRPASPGFDKCYIHVGVERGERKAAGAEATAMQLARQAVITYGLPRDIAPTDALLEEVRYAAGHVAWLREQVSALQATDLVWGITEESEKNATEFKGVDTTRAAAVSMWLELYHKERRYLLDVTKAVIAAGVEERRVKLAEAHGSLLNGVIRRILDRLGLSDEQRGLLPLVVPEELRRAAALASQN